MVGHVKTRWIVWAGLILFVCSAAALLFDAPVSQARASLEETPTPQAAGPLPPIRIDDQVILPGESFAPIVLADTLQDQSYPADQLTWNILGGSKLAADNKDGVVAITPVNADWRGTEGLVFEACDSAGACRVDRVNFWVMEDTSVPVTVTYVGNSGFMITAGDKKILIDGLFGGLEAGDYALPADELDLLLKAQPPFDGIDLILATHDHGDHFSADMVCQYLKASPATEFVSTVAAANAVRAAGCPATSINLQQGQKSGMVVNGLGLEAMFMSHGDLTYENLGYLVTTGGRRFFHTGDIDTAYVTADYLRALGLPEKQIDVAFIPHFYLRSANAMPVVVLQPGYVVPIHYFFTDPPMDTQVVLRYFPEAVVFSNEMENWTMP